MIEGKRLLNVFISFEFIREFFSFVHSWIHLERWSRFYHIRTFVTRVICVNSCSNVSMRGDILKRNFMRLNSDYGFENLEDIYRFLTIF